MLREIPSLQTLCLRSIGGHACSGEGPFAKTKAGEPSTSSRLLRSFHARPVLSAAAEDILQLEQEASSKSSTISCIPMKRMPCIGVGSARREHANNVDLHHPVTAHRVQGIPEMQDGNPALDCLQSYIDSLVELGRFDDTRLGLHFFEEWRANCLLSAGQAVSKKRRRSSPVNSANETPQGEAMCSLSLYHCTLSSEMMETLVESGLGPHLAVLDLTGAHGLTDEILETILPACPNLTRLSIKNCRRLTSKTTDALAKHQRRMISLDLGGCFNLKPQDVLGLVETSMPNLVELHVSGLGWSDEGVSQLVQMRPWKTLSLGFSLRLTQASLRQSLMMVAGSLTALALPFCESVVDNATLGILGRHLPAVKYLDLRGNPSLTTITGWYDGRASANRQSQELTVLGRYSGLTDSSVEETRRVHPLGASIELLTVIMDGGGMGVAIVDENR